MDMITAKIRRRQKVINAYKVEHAPMKINTRGGEVLALPVCWVVIDEDGFESPVSEKDFYDKYEIVCIEYKPST